MSRFDLPIYAAMALCAGPVMFARGFSALRMRRLIRNTPTARIRSLAMGLVEINGAVLERSLVKAPLSGRECAYWEVDISILMGRRGHRIVHRRNSGNPFYVDDGTGVVMVYPAGSVCKTQAGSEETCHGLFMPDVYARYMAEQGLWQRHLWRIGAVRFRERTLEEGQRVYVLGTAVPRAQSRDVSVPFEHPAWSSEEPELRATGTDGAAVGPRRTPRGPQRVKALHEQITAVIRRGEHDTTFVISTESELALEISYGASTLLNLFGGPLLTIMGLGYWLYAYAGRRLFE